MANARLAITRDGVDLLRVIPSSFDGNKLDIKVDCLGSDYTLLCYPSMRINPTFVYSTGHKASSLTYHHGAGGKEVVIHVKAKERAKGKPQYYTLPLENVTAPATDLRMPLPVLKLEIPDGFTGRKVKRKAGVRYLDAEPRSNVVELYMAGPEYDLKAMLNDFPELLPMLAGLPFETWSSCSSAVNRSKQTPIIPGEPHVSLKSVAVGPVSFFILQYHAIFGYRVEKLRLTFIDNAFSAAIMLGAQCFEDGPRRLLAAPYEKSLNAPYSELVDDKRNQALILRAMRRRPSPCWLDAEAVRSVDRQRERLLEELRRGHAALEKERQKVTRIAESGEELLASIGLNSGSSPQRSWLKHIVFAASVGLEAVLVHSCFIRHEARGVETEYCWITVGDLDISLDANLIKGWLGCEPLERVTHTEGIPYSEGLSGRRGLLLEAGFHCSEVSTSVIYGLREFPEGLGRIDLCMPLSLSNCYTDPERRREQLAFYGLTEEELKRNQQRVQELREAKP